MNPAADAPARQRKPEWLKVRLGGNAIAGNIKTLIDGQKLHTVCESAQCPNRSECWSRGTATIMILGDICTRSCGFCAVKTGRPSTLDLDEPRRVAESVKTMHLRHVVLTSVARDDLPDGGAAVWADTIRAVRANCAGIRIEVLIPDMKGRTENLDTILDARPDILNHNVETVPRLQKSVRPQAGYERSLDVLAYAKAKGFVTKSSLMLGLGEKHDEVESVLCKLRALDTDIVTLGQYLQPSPRHLPVVEWVTPAQFARWKQFALALGFRHVESGPLVRSSYHADENPIRSTQGESTGSGFSFV